MLNSVSFLEFIDTSAGIHELLSSRKEGMALAADIHFQNLDVLRRARFESFPASAHHGNLVIVGMNFGFHILTSLKLVFALKKHKSLYPFPALSSTVFKGKRKIL